MLKKYQNYTDDQFRLMSKKEYVSVREAAAFFGVGYGVLDRLYVKLPDDLKFRVGTRRYIHREKMSKYLETVTQL